MKKPTAFPIKGTVTYEEGKQYRYKWRKDGTAQLYTVCCDCGLNHLEQYKPTKRYLSIRVWREEEMTKQSRKGKLNRLRRAR